MKPGKRNLMWKNRKLFKLLNGDYLILQDITSIKLQQNEIVLGNLSLPCKVIIKTGEIRYDIVFPAKEIDGVRYLGEQSAREYMDLIANMVNNRKDIVS